MNYKSIQAKVLIALVFCLVLGTGCVVGLMHYFTVENSRGLATEAATGSQKTFTILEARDISKMTAVSDALIAEPAIRDAFAAKDRTRLLALTAPLYPQLKSEGITNWMFHTPEPDMTVFLRLHNPAKWGDHLNRFFDLEVARKHAIVSGNELARAGFAVRIIRPVYDSKGAVTGYIELGEELDPFMFAMKSQTGNDYGILLNKKFVDRQFWADSAATWKRRDNWDDHAGYVVEGTTTGNERIIDFQGDLATIPEHGEVLEQYQEKGSHFVRGIFPIRDAEGKTVGAMFVVKDITAVYGSMRKTQNILLVLTFVSLSGGIILLLTLLNRFIFKRLQRILTAATRLVGGDFETPIKTDSDDEVGKLEQLFEQFRNIFVSVLAEMSRAQQNK
ncbi:MAG: cache domain-containing protein [Terracidiphilus sp.]